MAFPAGLRPNRVLVALPLICFLLDGCTGPSARPGAEIPAPNADARMHNLTVLGRNPDAEGIFSVLDNGDIRHHQSGMVCPAKFPNVALWDLQVFPAPRGPGTDVGCDYGRTDAAGHTVSKLSIFATMTSGASTQEQEFAHYRREVETSIPTARYMGPISQGSGIPERNSTVRPESLSAEYDIAADQVHFRSQLIVALRGAWVYEIRATFITTIMGRDESERAEASRHAVDDLIASAMALYAVTQSVKGQQTSGTAGVYRSEIPLQRWLVTRVGDRVLFTLDSDTIESGSIPILDRQVEWLKANPYVRVDIEGHADDSGAADVNFELGLRRARAMTAYLVQHGIATDRLHTISYGKTRPVSQPTANRRAVMVVTND